MPTPALHWSDSWLLVALLQATESRPYASLTQVVGAADAVNHSIISREELESGFGRLVRRGLALVAPQGFAPSGSVREFWENNTQGWKALHESWATLARHVEPAPEEANPSSQVASEVFVGKQEYELAVAQCAVNVPHPFLPKP